MYRKHSNRRPGGGDLAAEVIEGPLQTVMPVNVGFPAEQLAGPGDVGLANFRVILGQRFEHELRSAAGVGKDLAGEFEDRNLVRVAEVDRLVELGEEQAVNS